MSRRQLAVLRALCAWRENEARRRDLPRNFVVREAALPQLARKQPKTVDALSRVEALNPKEIRLHGHALLRQVENALSLDPEILPQRIPPPVDLTPYRRDVDRLRREVTAVAEGLGLPPELLANRRTVASLVRRTVAGEEVPLPPELQGWRRREIGDRLVDLLSQAPAG